MWNKSWLKMLGIIRTTVYIYIYLYIYIYVYVYVLVQASRPRYIVTRSRLCGSCSVWKLKSSSHLVSMGSSVFFRLWTCNLPTETAWTFHISQVFKHTLLLAWLEDVSAFPWIFSRLLRSDSQKRVQPLKGFQPLSELVWNVALCLWALWSLHFEPNASDICAGNTPYSKTRHLVRQLWF